LNHISGEIKEGFKLSYINKEGFYLSI